MSQWTATWNLSFLSTLSLRRATEIQLEFNSLESFLSTLSLRRATYQRQIDQKSRSISIHALLAESDLYYFARLLCLLKFLSTLSLRRATRNGGRSWMYVLYFYPRSPCGERQKDIPELDTLANNFYPRSPCGERRREGPHCQGLSEFLSTLSLRRATPLLFLRSMIRTYFYPRSPCGERRS